MTNAEIAAVFEDIADLLDLAAGDRFRVISYRRAAENIAAQSRSVEALAREGGVAALQALPGLGRHISDKIVELLETGSVAYHQELLAQFPPSLLELLRVPGLGPKKVALFYRTLGITSRAELAAAATEQRLRDLPGMGAKSEEKILHSLELYEESGRRARLGEILPVAERLEGWLHEQPGVLQAQYAGSARRGRDTVGDLDLLAASADPAPVCAAFAGEAGLEEVLVAGDTKVSGLLAGRQVDLRVVPPESWGAALQYFTGSQAHNIALRARAQKRKLTLNEYGLFEFEDETVGPRVAGATEEEVYAALGLPWIPPELREDRGELAAAEEGRLPTLLTEADLRGDLHIHTDASDGHASLLEMVTAAEELGHEYIGITEHSATLVVTNGLDADRARAHRATVDALNLSLREQGSPLTVLFGTEADILLDGRLDLPEGSADLFDYVIGSVHSGFSDHADRMTERLLTALGSGQMDILGHPTGRRLLERPPYAVHLEEVLAAAAKAGVAVEINASPARLDLDDVHARLLQEQGGLLAINTDAHAVPSLSDLRYGVLVARRGWIEAPTVINTWPLADLRQWLARRRENRP
ncbi:MAG TPA: DNA polymerase/3'-5' exonuclease PolX [Armatimonadota bacterium]|jgi:DNA polymerase (family 10)